MSYAGTTAASTLTNPPVPIAGHLGGVNLNTTELVVGSQIWLYNSSHSTTELTDANFFADAFYIGMKQGDLVLGFTNTGSSVGVFLGVLSSVTTAGANLATTGGILSSTR